MVDLTKSQVSHELMTHQQSEKMNTYTSNILMPLSLQAFFFLKGNEPIIEKLTPWLLVHKRSMPTERPPQLVK